MFTFAWERKVDAAFDLISIQVRDELRAQTLIDKEHRNGREGGPARIHRKKCCCPPDNAPRTLTVSVNHHRYDSELGLPYH